MLLLIMVLCSPSEARNPDLSDWTRNLSEGVASSELGEDDFAPEIVVVGTTVHVMWLTQNGDYTGHKLYYRRSLDNGTTWQDEQLLLEHGARIDPVTGQDSIFIVRPLAANRAGASGSQIRGLVLLGIFPGVLNNIVSVW